MIPAIAAKDAAAAAPAAVAPIREDVRPVAAQCNKKVNPTAKKHPELREPVQPADGEKVTHFHCNECGFTRLAVKHRVIRATLKKKNIHGRLLRSVMGKVFLHEG